MNRPTWLLILGPIRPCPGLSSYFSLFFSSSLCIPSCSLAFPLGLGLVLLIPGDVPVTKSKVSFPVICLCLLCVEAEQPPMPSPSSASDPASLLPPGPPVLSLPCRLGPCLCCLSAGVPCHSVPGTPLSGLCRTLTLSEGSHPQPKLSPKPDARVQPPAPPPLAVPWACSPGQTQCLPRPDHTPSSVASHPRQAAPAGGEPGSPAGLSGSLPRKRPRSGPATSLPDCCRGPRRSPHSRPDSGPGSAACCSDDFGASHTPRPLVPLRSTQVGRRI